MIICEGKFFTALLEQQKLQRFRISFLSAFSITILRNKENGTI